MSLKLPRLKAMSVFDISKVTTCITLLATEVAPPAEDGVTFKFNKQLEKSRGGLESHMESHNPQPLCWSKSACFDLFGMTIISKMVHVKHSCKQLRRRKQWHLFSTVPLDVRAFHVWPSSMLHWWVLQFSTNGAPSVKPLPSLWIPFGVQQATNNGIRMMDVYCFTPLPFPKPRREGDDLDWFYHIFNHSGWCENSEPLNSKITWLILIDHHFPSKLPRATVFFFANALEVPGDFQRLLGCRCLDASMPRGESGLHLLILLWRGNRSPGCRWRKKLSGVRRGVYLASSKNSIWKSAPLAPFCGSTMNIKNLSIIKIYLSIHLSTYHLSIYLSFWLSV